MKTTKVSTTLSEDHVAQAKARVGERGFSRYLDEALARQLQFDRLADLEAELAAEPPAPSPRESGVGLLMAGEALRASESSEAQDPRRAALGRRAGMERHAVPRRGLGQV